MTTEYSMQSIALCQRLLNVEQAAELTVDGVFGPKTGEACAAGGFTGDGNIGHVNWYYAKVKTDGNGDPHWGLKALEYGVNADVTSAEMKGGHLRSGVPGDFVPIGVCNHHTAGAVREKANPRVSREGREGVPGPLYNFLVGQSGDVHFITNGRTHNAGKVDSNVVRHVREELSGPSPKPGRGDVSGNTLFYGVAMDHSGKDHQPVSGVAKAKMAALNRMFCDAWRWKPHYACNGHKELTSRKPDPMFDMGVFRGRVADFAHPARFPARPLPSTKHSFECPHCGSELFVNVERAND